MENESVTLQNDIYLRGKGLLIAGSVIEYIKKKEIKIKIPNLKGKLISYVVTGGVAEIIWFTILNMMDKDIKRPAEYWHKHLHGDMKIFDPRSFGGAKGYKEKDVSYEKFRLLLEQATIVYTK